MPDSLKDFSEKNPRKYCPMWNYNGLGQQNINKNDIINGISKNNMTNDNTNFRGRNTVNNPSESIFSVFNSSPGVKQQIIQDIIDHIRQNYHQANQTSLGRVFDIEATVKGKI
ncbi:9010_t:CDS:2 [Diversispora eburnea]|uniref:9010_t:CDS:1 n=1 Tax=Diversispora eburnea TaxID=1213867 RepID=A0A9N8V3Y8_9GLOM|nr:9010_t:CDS:2 [Diversispora eburnea]